MTTDDEVKRRAHLTLEQRVIVYNETNMPVKLNKHQLWSIYKMRDVRHRAL